MNNGDGTFTEQLTQAMRSISLSSMGADMADLNNDGYPEIFVTDMLPASDERLKQTSTFESYNVFQSKLQQDYYHQYMRNTLQWNHGNGTFSEISQLAGVHATDWSWGALLADFDNDGLRDIFVCNGIYKDVTD
ncbi:VCBS repeat-containing protein, partial [Arthrospira platensis SPKY1]|nr:VCBS repeat-containing protein [Arthrospira platensis SPKY1]